MNRNNYSTYGFRLIKCNIVRPMFDEHTEIDGVIVPKRDIFICGKQVCALLMVVCLMSCREFFSHIEPSPVVGEVQQI